MNVQQVIKKLGNGNRVQAARELGCTRAVLYKWERVRGGELPELYRRRAAEWIECRKKGTQPSYLSKK